MKCPKCKKEINQVNIVNECWQKAGINKKGKIVDYGSIEEILEPVKIECPECFDDISQYID